MKKFLFAMVFVLAACSVPTNTTDDVDPYIPLNLGTESACCTCGEGLTGEPEAKPGCGYPCCYAALKTLRADFKSIRRV